MPLYLYQAISEDGKKIAANIEAESLQDAKQKLIRRQIAVIKISLLSEKEIQKPLAKKEVLSLMIGPSSTSLPVTGLIPPEPENFLRFPSREVTSRTDERRPP